MTNEPFDSRYGWLNSNPSEVGGRDVDVHQLSLSLEAAIREAYRINAVPEEVVRLLIECQAICHWAEGKVKGLIERVSDDWAPDTSSRRYHQPPENCPQTPPLDCGDPVPLAEPQSIRHPTLADRCRLWIAGKHMGELESGAIVWEFQGVFRTEAEAVGACRTKRYFVSPAVLGQQLPDETEIWPVAFYPLEPEGPTVNNPTREEFIESYVAKSAHGLTRAEFDKRLVALPCRCGDSKCQGWAAVGNNEFCIRTHRELYGLASEAHPVPPVPEPRWFKG